MFSKISLKQNIVSNFAGQGWTFLIGIITVPIYINFLGIDGYGLLGFYSALQATFNLFLDFGLSVTIKREIARYAASPEKMKQARNLLRTMEIPYWFIGLFLSLIVCFSAPLLSTYWIQSKTIPSSTIEIVIVIMGIITFFRWPLTLYQGGLIGLQKIILLNSINVIVVTFRGAGSILTIWLASEPIIAFFLWQIVVSIVQLGITIYYLWHNLPSGDGTPHFQKDIIMEIWRFALGMGGTSLFTFFLTLADKIILSKVLSLEHFGYYSLASHLNEQLKMVNTQIIQPLFPYLSSLVSTNNKEKLRTIYHKSSQLVAIVILPIAGTAVFFSRELIYLWQQDMELASIVAPIATLLFAGTVFYSLLEVQIISTIAYGWVKFTFYRSLILSIIFIPLLTALSLEYGGVGAALAWSLLNLAQLIFLPFIVHYKILKGELKYWHIFDVGIPLFLSITILSLARWLMPSQPTLFQLTLIIGMTVIAVIVVVGLSAKDIRAWGIELFNKYRTERV